MVTAVFEGIKGRSELDQTLSELSLWDREGQTITLKPVLKAFYKARDESIQHILFCFKLITEVIEQNLGVGMGEIEIIIPFHITDINVIPL